jgi:hypothetical protein
MAQVVQFLSTKIILEFKMLALQRDLEENLSQVSH